MDSTSFFNSTLEIERLIIKLPLQALPYQTGRPSRLACFSTCLQVSLSVMDMHSLAMQRVNKSVPSTEVGA